MLNICFTLPCNYTDFYTYLLYYNDILYLVNVLYSWYVQRKRQSTPLDDGSPSTDTIKVKKDKKSKKEKKIKKEKLDLEEENWVIKIGQLKMTEEIRKQSFDNHNLLFLKINKYFLNIKWVIIEFVDKEMYNYVFIHKTILLLRLNWKLIFMQLYWTYFFIFSKFSIYFKFKCW